MSLNFNKTINVFTDASTTQVDRRIVSSPGYAIVYNNKIICSTNNVFYNTTSNYGELYAIIMALESLIQIKWGFDKAGLEMPLINIFSDSEISVLGLRKYIFNWWGSESTQQFYSEPQIYSDQGVLNKELFVNAIRMITDNNLKVNLYHVSAHIEATKKYHITRMIKKFEENNYIQIDKDDAYYLCYYNAFVDDMTRSNLRKLVNNKEVFDKFKYKRLKTSMMGFLTSQIICKYATLINKG